MAQVHLHNHEIPPTLVGILKSKGKSFHDRMDALAGVIDFLRVEELTCQS